MSLYTDGKRIGDIEGRISLAKTAINSIPPRIGYRVPSVIATKIIGDIDTLQKALSNLRRDIACASDPN